MVTQAMQSLDQEVAMQAMALYAGVCRHSLAQEMAMRSMLHIVSSAAAPQDYMYHFACSNALNA